MDEPIPTEYDYCETARCQKVQVLPSKARWIWRGLRWCNGCLKAAQRAEEKQDG